MIDSRRLLLYSRAATIAVFLALIRCLGEMYQFTIITPSSNFYLFLNGATVCSVALLAMTILSYFRRHVLVMGMGILAIVVLIILKFTA